MKNNGEEKFLVMCAADENKKAAENKIYKLSGFREQKLFYIFYSAAFVRSVITVNVYSLAIYTFSHLRIQNLFTNTE